MQSPLKFSNSASFWRPASVVRNRRGVANRPDLNAGGLQGTNCGVASRPRALYIHFKRPHAHFTRAIGCRDSGLLRCERSSFARSFEAERTGAGPAHDIAFEVG